MIKIDAGVLRAALVLTPKNDVRYYLNAVYVDSRDPKRIDVVSTDGHGLFAHRSPLKDETPEALRREWVLDRADLINLLKGAEYLHLSGVDEDSAKVLVQGKGGMRRQLVRLIDGRFPDWSKVVSSAVSAEPGCEGLDPAYVGDFKKIATQLGRSYPMIQSKRDAAAVVTFSDDHSIGLVMPMRGGTFGLPKWADALRVEPKPQPEPEAA